MLTTRLFQLLRMWIKCKSVSIETKAIEWLALVLFSVDLLILWIKSHCVNHLDVKAIKPSFFVVLCIMLYKMAPTFQSADEFLQCNHSMK